MSSNIGVFGTSSLKQCHEDTWVKAKSHLGRDTYAGCGRAPGGSFRYAARRLAVARAIAGAGS
jgi:hypothetical protein